MSIKKAYTQWATTYDIDNNKTRDLDKVITRQLLAEHSYTNILELGCGTGKNTSFLSTLADRVYALDFSEGMITKAKAKVMEQHISFSIANLAYPLPYTNQCVDLVTCNLVLEHIENLNSLFVEISRVLVEDGYLFISELHPFKQYRGKKATFQHQNETINIDAFVHHLSDFTNAAHANGFTLKHLGEWWRKTDTSDEPRLITFMFQK